MQALRLPAGAVGRGALGDAPESKRYFSELELSIYAGISTRTLQNWRLRNLGPPYLILRAGVGGRHLIRYDVAEFEQWLLSHSARSASGGGL